MFNIWKSFWKWFCQEEMPAVNSLVMETDLEKLQEEIRRHFPEAYASMLRVQHGEIWAVHQSRRHHPWSIQSTELAAWQEAARWIPRQW